MNTYYLIIRWLSLTNGLMRNCLTSQVLMQLRKIRCNLVIDHRLITLTNHKLTHFKWGRILTKTNILKPISQLGHSFMVKTTLMSSNQSTSLNGLILKISSLCCLLIITFHTKPILTLHTKPSLNCIR